MTAWFEDLSPRINLAGMNDKGSTWTDPRRVIYDHELMFFGSEGRHEIVIDGEVHACPQGHFIVIPPGRWHTCYGEGVGKIHRTWIHFDWVATESSKETPILTYAPANPEAKRFRRAPPWVPSKVWTGAVGDLSWVSAQCRRVVTRFNKGSAKDLLLAKAHFLELLHHLLGDENSEPSASDAVGLEGLLELLRQIAEQPFERAEMVRPAMERLGQSYDHQARRFKAAYGVSPGQYAACLRIEKIKRQLLEKPESVSSVAKRLGFSDPVYFSRYFKRYVGITPKAYRDGSRTGRSVLI